TKDIQALPAGDNVHFTYTGGAAADTMWVRLDSTAVASRNSIMTGREDFTFTLDGGAGNDNLNLGVSQLNGQTQAWYANQKLNANITVNGGDGNDTIRTPGAGDVKINGGSGNDTIYADNTGAQQISAGSANRAGAVYAAAEAAELAQALSVAMLQNNTDAAKLDAVLTAVNGLNDLNLVTPVEWNDPAAPTPGLAAQPTRATIQTAIVNAVTAGALTNSQAVALAAAYKTTVGPDTITVPTTMVLPAVTWSGGNAAALTQADWAAGNALLDTYIADAKAAAAAAAAAETNWAAKAGLLNGTQLAQINAAIALNGTAAGNTLAPETDIIGTSAVLNALTTLKSALVVGATAAQVVAALTTAWRAGAFGDPDVNAFAAALPGLDANDLFVAAGAFPMAAAGVSAVTLLLDVAINNANNANVAATNLLAARTATNDTAAALAAGFAGVDPVNALGAIIANDWVGSVEAAAAATAAATALTNYTDHVVTPRETIKATLEGLKTALAIGVNELQGRILIDNAQAALTAAAGAAVPPIVAPSLVGTAAAAGIPAVPVLLTNLIDITEKQNLDAAITALLLANQSPLDISYQVQADLQAVAAGTAYASAQATAAAAGAALGTAAASSSNAVWVLNTANQQAVGASGYVLAENDERNVFDLKSDANNSYNLFATTVSVTFKGIVATANVPNTGYKTSDLQVNQGIKDAINNHAVLSKLIVANDGPGNTLVITSLIDGQMSLDNLAIELKLPPVTALSTADVAAAAPIYGLAAGATAADVLTAMTAAKTAFDTKGDYVDQFAETGALNGNVNVRGAASTTPSDNTINGGTGNDVIVLGTTVSTTTPPDAMLSSTDTVVFTPDFGNDTVVHFRAGDLAAGGDVLNFSALGGSVLSTAFNVNKSINVANEVAATNGTAALVAGLYTDSATAQTHVYVAVDTATNIGKVYAVVDAAGTGSGSVSATLAGTIDLADTLWADLTAVNFA
ncbi:MAG: hypothetical protein IT500_13655, partial [Rubrivivax sp.]|nr:hypothetical protein [Rubrivivax sp.]